MGDIFLVPSRWRAPSADQWRRCRERITAGARTARPLSFPPNGATTKRARSTQSESTVARRGGSPRSSTGLPTRGGHRIGKLIAFASSVGELHSDEQREAFGDVRYVEHPRFYHLGRGWDDGSRKRVFVLPAAGGEARQLTDGECADEGDHSMVWSPDAREIAFVSNRSPEWWNTIDTNIYAVDVASGETRQTHLQPRARPQSGLSARTAGGSPTGRASSTTTRARTTRSTYYRVRAARRGSCPKVWTGMCAPSPGGRRAGASTSPLRAMVPAICSGSVSMSRKRFQDVTTGTIRSSSFRSGRQ